MATQKPKQPHFTFQVGNVIWIISCLKCVTGANSEGTSNLHNTKRSSFKNRDVECSRSTMNK